jgi:hypothetical protein
MDIYLLSSLAPALRVSGTAFTILSYSFYLHQILGLSNFCLFRIFPATFFMQSSFLSHVLGSKLKFMYCLRKYSVILCVLLVLCNLKA